MTFTHTILLVDDEPNVLCSILRNLRGKPYQFWTARNGDEALHILKTQTIDLVVSDERMPGMQGNELVTWIANHLPDVVRIILSGQASLPAALKAINYGRVYRFLTKPIKTVELALTISRALEERDELRSQLHLVEESREQQTVNVAERERLRGAADVLEERERNSQREAKERVAFLAAMTHELRSPLTALLGSADLLPTANNPDEQGKLVRVIQRSGQHLLNLVNTTLDHAKIAAGKMEIEWIPCSVAEIVDEAYSLFASAAQQKGIELAAVIAEDVPPTIVADPTRLRQALINLLANAVKFTTHGRVDLQVTRSASDPAQVEFSVRDTGPGMTDEEMQRLFTPFVQANQQTTRKYGGTGLGLSVSREIAKLLGGELEVESVSGVGSVFRLRIAPRPLTAPLELPSDNMPAENVLLGRRILLAEDSIDTQRFLNAMLCLKGAEITLVENGQQAVDAALAQADSAPFDVILMDLDMPLLSGIEATERLRELGYRHPIVALTASDTGDVLEACHAVGFDQIINKLVGKDRLIAAISHFTANLPRAAAELATGALA